ncbi:MAG: hypothetical protein K0T00_2139 [Gaiellaceae bacterium]|nr:hypothetical protein [Gaiellaceae bacterium]
MTKEQRVAGGAGLGPAGAEGSFIQAAAVKEGARGGTMGSPPLEKTGHYQSADYFTKD